MKRVAALVKFLRSPFVIALALSILLHSLLLWWPDIELPGSNPHHLVSLSAKLEPLPTTLNQQPPKAKKKPAPKPPTEIPATPEPEPEIAAASAVAETENLDTANDDSKSEIEEPAPPKKEVPRAPLPHFARLKFDVTLGTTGIKVGEATHALAIENGEYTLTANVRTSGVINLLKSFTMQQFSRGKADGETLYPAHYEEKIVNSDKSVSRQAEFDRDKMLIHFSEGGDAPLLEETQDILSMLYQFPTLERHAETVILPISTGKRFEQIEFEIAVNEMLETAMGNLTTIHFKRLRQPEKEGLEIWFGREYRYLPVKIVHYNRAGDITAIAIIREIEAAEN